eukprot:g19910.t1
MFKHFKKSHDRVDLSHVKNAPTIKLFLVNGRRVSNVGPRHLGLSVVPPEQGEVAAVTVYHTPRYAEERRESLILDEGQVAISTRTPRNEAVQSSHAMSTRAVSPRHRSVAAAPDGSVENVPDLAPARSPIPTNSAGPVDIENAPSAQRSFFRKKAFSYRGMAYAIVALGVSVVIIGLAAGLATNREFPNAAATVQGAFINVRSYGAIPDDGIDDASALNTAINAASTGDTIQLEGGTYNILSTIKFLNKNGISFKGSSSTTRTILRGTGLFNLVFLGDGSKNLTISSLDVDWYPLPFTGGVVAAIDPNGQWFDLEVAAPHEPQTGRAVLNYMLYEDAGGSGVYTNEVYQSGTGPTYLGGGKLRVPTFFRAGWLQVGQKVVARFTLNYAEHSFAVQGSDFIFSDINIYAGTSMGIAGSVKNIILDRFAVRRAPGRWLSTTGDGSHFDTTKGGLITIKDSLFEGMGDDGTNVHSFYYYVMAISANRLQVTVGFKNAPNGYQMDSLLNIPGRTVHFGHQSDPFNPFTSSLVTAVAKNAGAGGQGTVLTLSQPLASVAVVNDVVSILDGVASVLIQRTTYRNNRARGILLKTFAPAVIEDCVFTDTSGPAVMISAEASGIWWEASTVSDAILRSSSFTNNNFGIAKSKGVVMVQAEGIDNISPISPPAQRGILLQRNVFETQPTQGTFVAIGSADGIRVEANTFAASSGPIAQICRSRNVTFLDNLMVGGIKPNPAVVPDASAAGCQLTVEDVAFSGYVWASVESPSLSASVSVSPSKSSSRVSMSPSPSLSRSSSLSASVSLSPSQSSSRVSMSPSQSLSRSPSLSPSPGTCKDTDGWLNSQGYSCAGYASQNWCTNGGFTAGNEWTGGSNFYYPEYNCCVCGKPACDDTVGWSNGANGYTCAGYKAQNWCANGWFTAGNDWTGGSTYNFPENNCCVCGKARVCKDTLNWQNGAGYTCAGYASQNWCANGRFTTGAEWTGGSTYNFPENNCCVCGKPATVTPSITSSPSRTPITGVSATNSPSITSSTTRSVTASLSITSSTTRTRSVTASLSITSSSTRSVSVTSSRSQTSSPTRSVGVTSSRSPTSSPTRSVSVTSSRSPTSSPSRSVSVNSSRSPTSSPTRSVSVTSSRSPTSSPTRSV